MSDSGSLDGLWERLVAEASTPNGLVCLRTATAAPCDVFAGVHKPSNRLALYIEVRSDLVSRVSEYPNSAGFTVEPQCVAPGRHGRVRLVLSATDEEYHDVFKVVAEDVISCILAVQTEEQSVSAFLHRLYHWQAFFKGNALSGLGREAQQGLYAELLTIRDVLAPILGVAAAVASWRGPLGTNQDFELDAGGLEVKSSSANSQQKLYVNNPRQLDRTGVRFLFVLFWLLDVRRGALRTLPELIDDIRDLASENAAAREALSNRLLAAGFLDVHRDKYASTSYTVRDLHYFRVSDGFPRIDWRSLPAGIGDVRYSVELTACLPFQISEQTALEEMGQSNVG